MLTPATGKYRKRRPHVRYGSSAAPTPPPVHVVSVQPAPGEPTVATWVFDLEVDDPTAPCSGFVINGHPGIGIVRDDFNAFRIDHGATVSAGMSWSNTAFAGGIKSTDGGTLDAGSGTVTP